MRALILQLLGNLEKSESVRILYACESGSRAWGFESSDSDYDIRFIYVHAVDWYLSIDPERHRDVIERMDGMLDVGGWELRKALRLFRKTNPPLLEWLGSPIVYLEKGSLASRLRALQDEFCSPKACAHHYLQMARGNYRDYVKGSEVRLKKYFYVLRPLLAIQWIERNLGVVPTEFSVLVKGLAPRPLKGAIEKLLVQKKAGLESECGPAIPEISTFLESELERLESSEFALPVARPSAEPLNELFRDVLKETWR